MLFIGLDDTDNLESRGTGHLARAMIGYVVFGALGGLLGAQTLAAL